MERKSNKVVTVLIDDANAECAGGEGSLYVHVVSEHVTLKDLDARPFEEQLYAIYPWFSQNIVVDS